MRRVHFMSIHINRKWMIECQHSFDGKALFTVWLLMIVLGAPAVLPPCPPLPPAQPARRVLQSGVHGQPQPADRHVQCRGDFQFVTIMSHLSKSSISYDILF